MDEAAPSDRGGWIDRTGGERGADLTTVVAAPGVLFLTPEQHARIDGMLRDVTGVGLAAVMSAEEVVLVRREYEPLLQRPAWARPLPPWTRRGRARRS